MSYILFDSDTRYRLLPFTHTRPIADIRCGIYTMRERWEHLLKEKTSTLTASYLQEVYPAKTDNNNIYINAAVFATEELAQLISHLQAGECLATGDIVIAVSTTDGIGSIDDIKTDIAGLKQKQVEGEIKCLANVWDIFSCRL